LYSVITPHRSELRPPKLAPSTWQLFFTDWIQKHQTQQSLGDASSGRKKLNVAQAAKEAGLAYANLTPEEKEVGFVSILLCLVPRLLIVKCYLCLHRFQLYSPIRGSHKPPRRLVNGNSLNGSARLLRTTSNAKTRSVPRSAKQANLGRGISRTRMLLRNRCLLISCSYSTSGLTKILYGESSAKRGRQLLKVYLQRSGGVKCRMRKEGLSC